MDEQTKKEIQKAAKSLGDSIKAQKEEIKEESAKRQESEKAAKDNFARIKRSIIIPFLKETNDTLKAETHAHMTYITNEKLESIKAVTENFIEVYFHVKGGNRLYRNTPYIKLELNSYQNIIQITKQVDFREGQQGQKLDDKKPAQSLEESHITSYLLNFIKECIAYYGG